MILHAGSEPPDRGGTGSGEGAPPPEAAAPGEAAVPAEAARDDEARRATEEERVLEVLRLAFAPLHKRAFGTAVGTAAGLLLAFVTAYQILFVPPGMVRLELLRAYFAGYSVSWTGVLVGGAWGFGVGFILGWFAAFCRNLVVAISVFITRTRAELGQTRDFLDHI